MAKRLVELMGGVIGVESTVGVGSVFWLELDTVDAPHFINGKAAPAAAARAEVRKGAPLRTLLYVEDNPANLKLVERLIERRPDLHLLTAINANLGIAIARDKQPTVILMDINLPGINGTQALALLAEDPLTAHIPVLAISANAMPRDIERGLEAGFLRYLTKPINVMEFMNALDVAFESAERTPSKK